MVVAPAGDTPVAAFAAGLAAINATVMPRRVAQAPVSSMQIRGLRRQKAADIYAEAANVPKFSATMR
jgi:hypothetical protein